MKKETANNIAIAILIMSSLISSNIIGGIFWNILSVAFLIAGVYGMVCSFKEVKFLY